MNLYLIWVIALIVGGLFTGIIKSILGIRIASRVKHGAMIYGILDAATSAILAYILLSAVVGHWLQ